MRWGSGSDPSSVGGHIHRAAVAVLQERPAFRGGDSTMLCLHGGVSIYRRGEADE